MEKNSKYMVVCVAGQSNAVGYDESAVEKDYCAHARILRMAKRTHILIALRTRAKLHHVQIVLSMYAKLSDSRAAKPGTIVLFNGRFVIAYGI